MNDCPYNYYFDANNFCFVCDPSCFSCFGPSSSECNSCKNFFYNNSCYTECPSGTFANGSECYKCDDSCSACSTTKNNCTSCSLTHPFHYAFDRTCYTKCPVYTFLSNICVNECQVGFIPINNTCTPCDSECLDCFESTKTCTACDFGLFLFNSTCVSSCPSRYFPYEIFCYPCNEACSSCNDTNFCLACKDPLLFLDIEKGLCSSLCRIGTYAFNHTGIPACPLSYYPDTYRNCQKCPDQCLSCSNNSTCTACASGFYALGTDCLKDCPFSYYNILKNMTCGLCNSECLECVGNEISNCTVCNHGKFVLIENNIGQCVDLCPDGYYQWQTMCFKCNYNCSTCIGQDACTGCKEGFFIKESICSDHCGPGDIGINQRCIGYSSLLPTGSVDLASFALLNITYPIKVTYGSGNITFYSVKNSTLTLLYSTSAETSSYSLGNSLCTIIDQSLLDYNTNYTIKYSSSAITSSSFSNTEIPSGIWNFYTKPYILQDLVVVINNSIQAAEAIICVRLFKFLWP